MIDIEKRTADPEIKALLEMRTQDQESGVDVDTQAYRESYDELLHGRTTEIEVKMEGDSESYPIIVRSVGNEALKKAMAVDSEPWQIEEK